MKPEYLPEWLGLCIVDENVELRKDIIYKLQWLGEWQRMREQILGYLSEVEARDLQETIVILRRHRIKVPQVFKQDTDEDGSLFWTFDEVELKKLVKQIKKLKVFI